MVLYAITPSVPCSLRDTSIFNPESPLGKRYIRTITAIMIFLRERPLNFEPFFEFFVKAQSPRLVTDKG